MTPEIPGVKGLVARLLLQDPDLTNREMHGRAVERYPQLQDVSLREFNARYVLQVKRNMVGRKPRRPLPMPGENGTRPEPTPPSRNGPDDREEGLDLLRRAAADARRSFQGYRTSATDRPPSSTASGGSPSATALDGSVGDREDSDPPPAGATPSPAPSPLTAASPPEQEERRPPRETLRVLFFKLALELELSRNDSELVDVIAGVDRYVDEALAAVRG